MQRHMSRITHHVHCAVAVTGTNESSSRQQIIAESSGHLGNTCDWSLSLMLSDRWCRQAEDRQAFVRIQVSERGRVLATEPGSRNR